MSGVELNNNLVSDVYVGDDGKLHKVIGGADTVLPFSGVASNLYAHKESNSAGAKYNIVNNSKYVVVSAFSSTEDKFTISDGILVGTSTAPAGFVTACYRDVPAGATITNKSTGGNWAVVLEIY